MGIIKRKFNRNVQIKGVKDDVVYQDVHVNKHYSIFGITLYSSCIDETIAQSKETIDIEDTKTKPVGYQKK